MALQNAPTTFTGKTWTTGEHVTSAKLNANIGDSGSVASEDMKAKFAEMDANNRHMLPITVAFEDLTTPGTYVRRVELPTGLSGEIVGVSGALETSDATTVAAQVKKNEAGGGYFGILGSTLDLLGSVGDTTKDLTPTLTAFDSAVSVKLEFEIVVTGGTTTSDATLTLWLKTGPLAVTP